MTQEFLISVTPVGDDEYLVRTERTPKVPSGVPLAQEQIKWPVDDWLQHTRYLMKDPLWGVLEGSSYAVRGDAGGRIVLPNGSPSLSLVELGQELYNSLFQGTLRDSWTSAQAIAYHRQEPLQLRLGLKGQRLGSLPWEVLHEGGRPIATGTDVFFSRYQPGTAYRLPQHHWKANQPLKILMAIAAPNDLESLQLKREALHLQQELQPENYQNGFGSHPIEITILEQPDREQITQALEQGQYQIFHYAGHSTYAATGGSLYLVSGRTGLSETISGEDLAGLLVNNGVLLAVLNSCRGAYSNPLGADGDTPELNLAEALVKRGVPGVLAMAERIPDEVALTLTRLLYRQLNQGYPVDLSLSRARQGLISAYGSHQIYWALPVLYLHHEFDGILKPGGTGNGDYSRVTADYQWRQGVSESAYVTSEELDEAEDLTDDMDDAWSVGFDEPLDLQGNGEDLSFIGNTLEKIQASPVVDVDNNGDRDVSAATFHNRLTIKESFSSFGNRGYIPSWLGILLAVILLSMGWGLWRFQHQIIAMLGYSPLISSEQPRENNLNSSETLATALEVARNEQVLGIAIEQFERANLEAGVQATEELLNRGSVTEANAALTAVPVQYQDEAAINFLRGRLAWQSIERGNVDYSWDDVRRFWARAVEQQPNSVEYNTALGFAYYVEGDLERAYQVWLNTLELTEPFLALESGFAENPLEIEFGEEYTPNMGTVVAKKEMAKSSSEILDNSAEFAQDNHEILNSYAGLGLVLMKSASSLPTDEQVVQLSKAVKFREKVLSEAPDDFRSHALAEKWLWSTDIIRDWEQLMRI